MGNGSICTGDAFSKVFKRRYRCLSTIPILLLVLITYDVNTETAAGKSRLRKVAKQCVNYGRRVQNSVFECILDNAQSVLLKSILTEIIDEEVDSLRFYYLGNNYKTKVEHVGVDRGLAVDQALIL